MKRSMGFLICLACASGSIALMLASTASSQRPNNATAQVGAAAGASQARENGQGDADVEVLDADAAEPAVEEVPAGVGHAAAVAEAAGPAVPAIPADGELTGMVGLIDPLNGRLIAVQDVIITFVETGHVVAQTRPDQQGRFVVEGLPAGVYAVIATGPPGFAAFSFWLSPVEAAPAAAAPKLPSDANQVHQASLIRQADDVPPPDLLVPLVPAGDMDIVTALINRNFGAFTPVGGGMGLPPGFEGTGAGGGGGGGGGEGGLGALLGLGGLAAAVAALADEEVDNIASPFAP